MFARFETAQVYHPDRQMDSDGTKLGRPFEDLWLTARDGPRLNAWFYPAFKNSPRSHVVVLFCHGNAGNISHRLESCAALLETGVNVLLFDYRGYGRSAGTPSEEGTYLDAQASYAWLIERGFQGRNIIAFGESLGGGVASELAVREQLGGLILQSTFTSIPDVGSELFPWLPVRWLARIHYDTRAKLPRIKAPVLIMHSQEDDLVSFKHAQANFAAANEPKTLWEFRGGHNDPLLERESFVQGLQRFISGIGSK